MPKVSVIMSVYKEAIEWIILAIDSILNQSYKDFEFIIVNDNPVREENVSLLNEYSSRDNRIRIINNEVNIGLTRSLNKGLGIAKGEYIARMDADDVAFPLRFEKQVNFLESNKNIFACGASAITIDENGKEIGLYQVECDSTIVRSLLPFRSPLIHPLSMFRRIIDNKMVLYDENYKYSQDYALWADHILNNIANINEILLKYRITDSQISSFHRKEQIGLSCKIQNKALKKLQCTLRTEDEDVFLKSYSMPKFGLIDFVKYIKFVRHFVYDNMANKLVDINIINGYLQSKGNQYLLSCVWCWLASPLFFVSKLMCMYYTRGK